MGRPAKQINLSKSDHQALQEGYTHGSTPAFRRRCHGVLLKSQGRSYEEIGRILGVTLLSVENWVKRYEENGVEGLHTSPGQGRKPILEESDAPVVQEVIQEERQRLKHAQEMLTKKLNKQFSTKTLKRFLKVLATDGNGFVVG